MRAPLWLDGVCVVFMIASQPPAANHAPRRLNLRAAGRDDLNGQGTGAIMSYGDLIWTTLSRLVPACIVGLALSYPGMGFVRLGATCQTSPSLPLLLPLQVQDCPRGHHHHGLPVSNVWLREPGRELWCGGQQRSEWWWSDGVFATVAFRTTGTAPLGQILHLDVVREQRRSTRRRYHHRRLSPSTPPPPWRRYG